MPSILFFEDYPYASENRLFRSRLRFELNGTELQITQAKTVSDFENAIHKFEFDIIILDIMASSHKGFVWGDTKNKVSESMTGIELLRRCRRGIYGYQYVRPRTGAAETRSWRESRFWRRHTGVPYVEEPVRGRGPRVAHRPVDVRTAGRGDRGPDKRGRAATSEAAQPASVQCDGSVVRCGCDDCRGARAFDSTGDG